MSTSGPRDGNCSPVKALNLEKVIGVQTAGRHTAALQEAQYAVHSGDYTAAVLSGAHYEGYTAYEGSGAEITSSTLLRASDGMAMCKLSTGGMNADGTTSTADNASKIGDNILGAIPNSKTMRRLFEASVTLMGEMDAKRTIASILVEAQKLVASAEATSLFYLYEPHKHGLTPIVTSPLSNRTHSRDIHGVDTTTTTTAAVEASNGSPDAVAIEARTTVHSGTVGNAVSSTESYLGSAFETTFSSGVELSPMECAANNTAGTHTGVHRHTGANNIQRENNGTPCNKSHQSTEQAASGSSVPLRHKLVQCGPQITLTKFGGADDALSAYSHSAGHASMLDPAIVAFFSRKYVTRCARRTNSPTAPTKHLTADTAPAARERCCSLTVPVSDNANSIRALIKVSSAKCTLKNGKCIFSDEDILALFHLARLAGVSLCNAALYNDALVSRDLAEGVLRLIGSMSPELTVQSAVLSLTTNAKKIIRVKQCTVYLIDRLSSQLLLISSDITQPSALYRHFNIDDESSMFGECIKQGKAVADNLIETSALQLRLGLTPNCVKRAASIESSLTLPVEAENRVLATPRLHFSRSAGTRPSVPEMISKSELLPHGRYSNAAVAPILSECRQAIGLIELINKRDSEGYLAAFSDENLLLIETLGRLVGPRLERSELGHKAVHRRTSEAARADNLKEVEVRSDRRPSVVGLSIPEEEEEVH